jgi:hypothetical protein
MMFMAFYAPRAHQPWLIAFFSMLLVIGGIVGLLT